jgi:hypothetical protein
MVTFVIICSNKLRKKLEDISVCFTWMLRSVVEWFVVDIPGQHIGLILKGESVYKNYWTARLHDP